MKAMMVAKSAPRAVIDELAFKPEDVYAKTELAVVELKHPECSLPQRLKTVLILIDGRTPYASFARTLKSYGAVDELFSVLRDLGYIVKVGEAQVYATPPAPIATPMVPPPATPRGQAIPITRTNIKLSAKPSIADALGDPAHWELPVIAQAPAQPTAPAKAIARQTARLAAYEPPPSLVPSLSSQSRALKACSEILCDAVSNHAGFDGMELMLAIERCVLIADLRLLLPKVQALLEPGMSRGPLQTLMDRVDATLSV
jgi:hypothetical protein